MKVPNVNCLHCKKQVYVPKYRTTTFKYCSRKCLGLASRIQMTKSCEICGVMFAHISSRSNTAKYCSRECYYVSQKRGGQTIYQCEYCKKEFRDSLSKGRKYCSKQCIGKHTRDKWCPKFTTVRKKMIREGLVSQCFRCGYDKVPQILGIHHIDGSRANNSLENLMVLCPMCHSLTHLKHICH